MDVMATEAGDAMGVHRALHEVVALHPVLMSCAVGEMSERELADGVVFQSPVIAEILSNHESHRPVKVFAFDRVL